MVATTALLCLALNVYHEARGEPEQGQYAVALVTWNRAAHKKERLCPVVMKPKQFSWTTTLAYRVVGGYRLKADAIPKELEAWDKAVTVAMKVIGGRVKDFTKGALYYHERSIKPRWSKKFHLIMVLGNHVFYTDA